MVGASALTEISTQVLTGITTQALTGISIQTLTKISRCALAPAHGARRRHKLRHKPGHTTKPNPADAVEPALPGHWRRPLGAGAESASGRGYFTHSRIESQARPRMPACGTACSTTSGRLATLVPAAVLTSSVPTL